MSAAARALLIGLPLLLGAVPARADDADDADCNNAVTQFDMNVCADKDYQKADAELNRAYKEAMHDRDASAQSLLRTAQRNWIKFRDTECKRQTAEDVGGSIYPMEMSECLARLTRARTKELHSPPDE